MRRLIDTTAGLVRPGDLLVQLDAVDTPPRRIYAHEAEGGQVTLTAGAAHGLDTHKVSARTSARVIRFR